MLVAETGKIYFQDSISKSILIGLRYYVFHHLQSVSPKSWGQIQCFPTVLLYLKANVDAFYFMECSSVQK